jgi:predicted small lipoprotein YifL
MRLSLLLLLTLAPLVGCGQSEPPEVVVNWGEVDKSLSPAQQAVQTVMSRFLKAVQSGADFNRLYTTLPNVIVRESESEFYGEGVHLVGWDWTGPPQGNVVGVHLKLLLDIPPGDQTTATDRKYKVTKSGANWTIARQPN